MVNFEIAILDIIRENIANPLLDAVMPIITYLGSGGMIWIAVTLFMIINKKYRQTGVVMAVSLVLSLVVCNGILKPVINRVRPYGMRSVALLIKRPMGASFPSGHASASFAAAAALALRRNKLWLPAIIMAALIAFSRLYLYVHYPSDVLSGAVLGTALAYAADRIVNAVYKKIN